MYEDSSLLVVTPYRQVNSYRHLEKSYCNHLQSKWYLAVSVAQLLEFKTLQVKVSRNNQKRKRKSHRSRAYSSIRTASEMKLPGEMSRPVGPYYANTAPSCACSWNGFDFFFWNTVNFSKIMGSLKCRVSRWNVPRYGKCRTKNKEK